MKLPGELHSNIYEISWLTAVVVRVCVCGCGSVFFIFPPYGRDLVISYSIACIPARFWFFFCFVDFLFVWMMCTLAEAKTRVVVVDVQSQHSLHRSTSQLIQTYDLSDGPVTWTTQPQI